jgi:FlaA1/EpsC-like NDP-sugar epimerase
LKLVSRTTQGILDIAILSLAYWAAFFLRFDVHLPFHMWKRLLFTWPYVVSFEFAVMTLFAVPRFSWRHMGLRESIRVLWAVSAFTLALLIVRIISELALPIWDHAIYTLIPLGVIAGNFALSFLGVVGVRISRRITVERESTQRLNRGAHEKIPTLLVGAGEAGALVAREIERRPDLGIQAVAFVDDDPAKAGTIVQGIRVWGQIDQLTTVAERLGARQVLITIADLEPQFLRRILLKCEAAQLPTKVLPGLYQVIEEQSGLGRLRDVSIEDLLGRESVKLDMALVRSFLRGKRVMVSGAGGSIGSELCRQVARFDPESLALVERSEFALFTIHQELFQSHPKLDIIPRICDICDAERLEAVFATDRPQVVFHAAAHKHVPMMEWNPGEAVKNNVFGTKLVADASSRHGCEAFVMISTDKAVNPTSIMGASKRVAEMYVQALSARSSAKYVAVRFGNVLGSTGSVIPTFKAQIAAGGPVTVTHPDMKRYFMTIPEASQLVLQAAAMGRGGEIFVLDMGSPVKIVDLAHDLIRLSGLVPDVDIKIQYTGMRPGEKLFEELGFDAEHMSQTAHPKIYIGRLVASSWSDIEQCLAALAPYQSAMSDRDLRAVFGRVVPEMGNSSLSLAAADVAILDHAHLQRFQEDNVVEALRPSTDGNASLPITHSEPVTE